MLVFLVDMDLVMDQFSGDIQPLAQTSFTQGMEFAVVHGPDFPRF